MMSTCGTTVAVDGRHAGPGRAQSHRYRQRGSELIEFTLVILPVLMFMGIILDVAWAVYTRSTLQYAVAQGVRYAITFQTMPGLQQVDSIKATVQNNAFGKLGTAHTGPAWDSIQVHFFLPNGTDVSTVEGGDIAVNGVYPLVEVSVENFSHTTFFPTIRLPGMGALNPINMAARAWDRMEAPPATNAPKMF